MFLDYVGFAVYFSADDVWYNINIFFLAFVRRYNFETVQFVPICALSGANLVEIDVGFAPWYEGPSLFECIDRVNSVDHMNVKFPFGMVIKVSKYSTLFA